MRRVRAQHTDLDRDGNGHGDRRRAGDGNRDGNPDAHGDGYPDADGQRHADRDGHTDGEPTATLAAGCPGVPSNTCFNAGSIVTVRDSADPSKEQFQWKWINGVPAVTLGDLGDPVSGGTAYSLGVAP